MSRRYQINRMLDQNIDDVHLNYSLAMELAREGQIAIAMLQFRRVRELDPHYFPAYIQAALMLAQEGVYSLAREILSEGIAQAQPCGESIALQQMIELLKSYDLEDVD